MPLEATHCTSIGPDSRYSRHSEGDFLRLKDGAILFAYTRFFQEFTDEAPSALVAIRSEDEGETWSEPWEIISADLYRTRNVMSVSLLRMRDGAVGLFYIVKQKPWYTRIMLSLSYDEGRTFHEHRECTLRDRRGWYVLNNSRVERLHTGRLILPLAYHRAGVDEETGKAYIDSCACACMLYSDDDGLTWQESPQVIHPPFTDTQCGLQEPGVIQRQNGDLWAYFRTDKGCQYEAFSFDGGLHWTLPQPSRFSSPVSPMKIARAPETGMLVALWNPVPMYAGRSIRCEGIWMGGRTPFVCAMSRDDGLTWSEPETIGADPRRGYCYPAVFFTRDNAMLVAVCAGNVEDRCCLARLDITKWQMEDGV